MMDAKASGGGRNPAPETKDAQGETKPPKSGTKTKKNDPPGVDEIRPPKRKPAGRVAATSLRTTADLARDPENPRDIEPANLTGLQSSTQDYGDLGGITFNLQTGQLVTGHQRLETLERAAGGPCQIVISPDLADGHILTANGERFALRLVDWPMDRQRSANLAANNPHLAGHFSNRLQPQLEDIRARSEAMFKSLRLDRLAKPVPRPGKGGDDAVPEVPPVARTKTGNLYRLGDHRLLCGDVRVPVVCARLMDGKPADLLLTDPPYCSGGFQEAQRGAGTWGNIAADNLSTRGYQNLITAVLTNIRPASGYLFTDWRMWTTLCDISEEAGLAVRQMIVWDKGNPGLGSLWRPQHELILYGSRSSSARTPKEVTLGNVIQASRTGNDLHYTQKPVDLMVKILENDAKGPRKDRPITIDPFAGSGTTLMACEQLGRPCYAAEIEPRIVDVIVDRWEAYTGKKAEVVQ